MLEYAQAEAVRVARDAECEAAVQNAAVTIAEAAAAVAAAANAGGEGGEEKAEAEAEAEAYVPRRARYGEACVSQHEQARRRRRQHQRQHLGPLASLAPRCAHA